MTVAPKYRFIFSLHLCLWIGHLLGSGTLWAQEIQLDWESRTDIDIEMPSSIRVFEGNGTLADGAPVRALYATVDLRNENLQLRSIGSNTIRETTLETAQQNKGILAINGGYFATDHSVSLIIQDGELIAPGIDRPRAAFGLVNREPEITWTLPDQKAGIQQLEDPDKKTQKPWFPSQAIGGGPMLIKKGKLQITSKAEGFGGSHVLRHPRTAIGYIDKHNLILMIVDGRQNASAGVTLEELAELMLERGATEALNLDGGGSSVMTANQEVVNVPSDVNGGNRNRLRQNAGALVITQKKPADTGSEKLLDTESSTYSEKGIWETGHEANFYGESPARQAASHSHNKAFYSLKEFPQTNYQLSVWNPVNPIKEKKNLVSYVIHQGNDRDTLTLNQFDQKNFGKWNVLGEFLLGPTDKIEVFATKGGKFYTDGLRLIPTAGTPELPKRGDYRFAVISDLNSGLGATDYEWQVDSIVQRIPKFWQPDMVLSAGDLVAGMGISDTTQLRKMWKSFEQHITQPLLQKGIPFAFTLGNHDAHHSKPIEKKFAGTYWKNKAEALELDLIDAEHFPYFYSFQADGNFFLVWDASSGILTDENLTWTKNQLKSDQAKNANNRFVIGHMPLYGVAKERDGKGDLLPNPDQIRKLLEEYNVNTYISGHQHAYYPGKRGKLDLLNTGAAGSGPRSLLGEDTGEINTITIVDLFYKQDKITYTTYAIKEKESGQLQLLKHESLPSSIFSDHGFILRQDIATSAQEGYGEFSNINHTKSSDLTGKGKVTATINNATKLDLEGEFELANYSFSKNDSLQLYVGKNTEKEQLIVTLKSPKKRKNTYRFKDRIKTDLPLNELLAVGAIGIKVKTQKGNLQTQLYPETNTPPTSTTIISHPPQNTYGIRNEEALVTLKWEPAEDTDGDKVSYRYELAKDSSFSKPLLQENTGRKTALKLKESTLFELIEQKEFGEEQHFYHRIISTDGKHLTYGQASPFLLQKSDEPFTGLMETEAPNYQFLKKVGDKAQGYGAAWDKEGNLWLADYSNGLIILDKELNPIEDSPMTEIEFQGKKYSLSPVTGLNHDNEGNILAAINRRLIKIDAKTKKAVALWEVPEGNRAITTPIMAKTGEIFAMSLFGEDDNYVLKENADAEGGMELMRTLPLKDRILARSFAMSPDGKTLYFPDPGIGKIQVYHSDDRKNYNEEETITDIIGGSSAVKVTPNQALFMAYRTNGISPSGFHYRNEQSKQRWTLELPELNGAEPRGIGVSADEKTLIFCSWDKQGGYYLYQIKDED